MITALVSALTGLLSGVVPDIIQEVRDSRNASREVEFLRLQHQFQLERMKFDAGSKMDEAGANIVAEEVKAMREHLTTIVESQAKPTGIAWIDGFNSVLRPLTAALVMVLFVVTASFFVAGVMEQYAAGSIDAQTMATVIWASLVGESIQAVLAFLFGYRSARKAAVA